MLRNILPLMAANARSINYTPTSQKEAEKVKILTALTFFFCHSVAIVVLGFLCDGQSERVRAGVAFPCLPNATCNYLTTMAALATIGKGHEIRKISFPHIRLSFLTFCSAPSCHRETLCQQPLVEYSASSAIVGQSAGISSCFY